MSRLLFEKTGVSIWSSHLDLMRALMRSFRRAGIELKHSQGFTPHPELSILMPLSVGVESQCEIAEFTPAEGCKVPVEEIAARLNPVLPAGIRALESYDGGRKAGRLAWLRARLTLCFDSAGAADGRSEPESDGMQQDRLEAIRALFARPSLTVEKHGKKGPTELDIVPMIRELTVSAAGNAVLIEAVVAAQNPTLNPLLLVTAIETCLPECRPDQVRCRRIEIYDQDMNPFR